MSICPYITHAYPRVTTSHHRCTPSDTHIYTYARTHGANACPSDVPVHSWLQSWSRMASVRAACTAPQGHSNARVAWRGARPLCALGSCGHGKAQQVACSVGLRQARTTSPGPWRGSPPACSPCCLARRLAGRRDRSTCTPWRCASTPGCTSRQAKVRPGWVGRLTPSAWLGRAVGTALHPPDAQAGRTCSACSATVAPCRTLYTVQAYGRRGGTGRGQPVWQ